MDFLKMYPHLKPSFGKHLLYYQQRLVSKISLKIYSYAYHYRFLIRKFFATIIFMSNENCSPSSLYKARRFFNIQSRGHFMDFSHLNLFILNMQTIVQTIRLTNNSTSTYELNHHFLCFLNMIFTSSSIFKYSSLSATIRLWIFSQDSPQLLPTLLPPDYYMKYVDHALQ